MARLLVTLDEVKRHMGETSDRLDEEITDLISEASEKVIRKSGREFLPENEVAHARLFDVNDDVVLDRELELGDLASPPTQVRLLDDAGALREVVVAARIVCLPRRRESWQPISHLRFVGGYADSPVLYRGDVVEVTGVWGFPAVPPDIRREVRKTVQAWLTKDVKALGQVFKENNPGFRTSIGQHELPLSATQAAESYHVAFGGSD